LALPRIEHLFDGVSGNYQGDGMEQGSGHKRGSRPTDVQISGCHRGKC
jgi:hypothetical protein